MEREARVLQQEGDLAAAHELAARGAKLFPTSPGGKLCQNLVNEIEAKSAGISTERVWNAPWPKITVRYANVGAVYFRAIPVDWALFLERRNPRPENLTEQQRREVSRQNSRADLVGQTPADVRLQGEELSTCPPRRS